MSEAITLYGGSRDSETVECRGGDLLEFLVFERMVADYDFQAKNESVPFKTALYRHSLRNRSIFVYQP